MGEFAAFAEMERGSWSDAGRASNYVNLFAAASDQAIESLLDSVGAQPGRRVLDLCCGQGNVSAALISRGCEVVGVDFSPAMLALARKQAPSATFIEADAQDLPFDDAGFEIVVSNLGVCHIPDQPRALRQARRMLRPGGRFGMTVWCGPDVSPCFDAVYAAVKTHGSPAVSVPQGPDFHQFSRRDVAEKLLSDAGFMQVGLTIVDCAWSLDSPEALFDIYDKGTVRAGMLLARQPPEHRAAIQSALAQTVRERFACGDGWRVPVPAALLRATA